MDSKSWTTCSPRLALQKFSFLNHYCSWVSQDSSVCTDWTSEESSFRLPARAREYSLLQSVQTGTQPPGPTQPIIQRLLWALSPGIKRSGREADHSPHTVPKSRRSGTKSALLHIPKWRAEWQLYLYCFEGMMGRSHPYVLQPFKQCHWCRPRLCQAAMGYGLDGCSSFPKQACISLIATKFIRLWGPNSYKSNGHSTVSTT
jgi:hypothetical protein